MLRKLMYGLLSAALVAVLPACEQSVDDAREEVRDAQHDAQENVDEERQDVREEQRDVQEAREEGQQEVNEAQRDLRDAQDRARDDQTTSPAPTTPNNP